MSHFRVRNGLSKDVSDVCPAAAKPKCEPAATAAGAREVPQAILQALCCPVEWSLEGKSVDRYLFFMSIWWAEGRSMETAVWKNWGWIGNGLASGRHLLKVLLNLRRILLCFFYNFELPQGVVELLDRENDWLEMSQEDSRVICFTFFERSFKKIWFFLWKQTFCYATAPLGESGWSIFFSWWWRLGKWRTIHTGFWQHNLLLTSLWNPHCFSFQIILMRWLGSPMERMESVMLSAKPWETSPRPGQLDFV